MGRFFTELRRRKVVQFGLGYLVVGWLVIQIAIGVFPELGLPDWADALAIVLVALGFPLVIIVAWAQETQAEREAPAKNDAPQSREADPPSIAVLPFENMSDDHEQEYLADGMTEELINLLTNIPSYRITARNSSFAYKGKHPDIREVGEALGVRYVVEGSTRRVDENIRVTAQLNRSSDGTHVWSETFDRPMADIFAVQDEVVDAIFIALSSNLIEEERSRVRRVAPESLDAWGLLMRAGQIFELDRRSREEKLSLTQEALKIDPEYARANALMANLLALEALMGSRRKSEAKSREAEHHAKLALKVGQSDPDVLIRVAFAYSSLGDHRRSVSLAERAYELFGRPTIEYVNILGRAGQIDEAIALHPIVMEQSTSKEAEVSSWMMGVLLAIKGDYEGALPFALRAHDANPEGHLLIAALANLYGHLGRAPEAQEAWAKVQELVPGTTVRRFQADYRQVYGTEGAAALTDGFKKAGIED